MTGTCLVCCKQSPSSPRSSGPWPVPGYPGWAQMGVGVWESPPGRPHSIQDPLPGFTTCRAGAPSRVNCTAAGAPSKVIFTAAEGEGEDGAFWVKICISSRETPSPGWGVLTPRVALTCAAWTPGPGPPRAPPSLPPPSNPVPALAALTP